MQHSLYPSNWKLRTLAELRALCSICHLKHDHQAERAYKRYKLEEVLALFHLTQARMGLATVAGSAIGHTYLATHQELGTSRRMVLGRSSEWYTYHLNIYADNIGALVCATHDSCVPIPVFALDTPSAYYPSLATRYHPLSQIPARFFRTKRGHKMLLGALMCRLPEAEQVLSGIPRSTRYHLELEVRQLLLRKRGRPIAGATGLAPGVGDSHDTPASPRS
jgi:hypothetical protein